MAGAAAGADRVDVVALHDEFFNVVARAFPRMVDLHYGLLPVGDPDRSLRGLAGRIRRGQELLLDRMTEVAGWAPSLRALDLGCGLAGTSMALHRRLGFTMTGLNLNASQARMARERLAGQGLVEAVDIVRGDGCAMPFASGSLDAVVAIEVAFHVRDKARLFSEVARTLRPGGRFVLVDEEWREALQVMDFLFYPATGDYEALGRASGLGLTRLEDVSPEAARWMDDYARASSPPVLVAMIAGLALSGSPRLAWRFARAMSFLNGVIMKDVAARGMDVSTVPWWGAMQRLREHFAACFRDGGAKHGIWVFAKE